MEIKSSVYAIIATICWGASFILTKQGVAVVSPFLFAFLRYFIASLFFSILIIFHKNFTFKGEFILLAFIGVAMPTILQNVALKYTSAYISGFLQSTGPLYTLMLAVAFLKEKFTWNKLAGIIIAFFGTYMIANPAHGDFYGNMLVLLSAIFYSLGSVYSKKLINSGNDALAIISYATIFSLIFFIPSIPLGKIDIKFNALLYAIILAIFPTFIAYILWYKAMEKMEISKLSCFVYLIPFFALIFSYFSIHEVISLHKIIFGLLIVAGVAIAEA